MMRRVVAWGESSHKSLLNPWRLRRTWELELECGHPAWRLKSRFPAPPRRVKCAECTKGRTRA